MNSTKTRRRSLAAEDVDGDGGRATSLRMLLDGGGAAVDVFRALIGRAPELDVDAAVVIVEPAHFGVLGVRA
ncbi:hypothetical protein [Natrinema soli]|uniref:Uncharacterized protein n=1 Tax=Natrinema soli TaxID=1930624 RepID=A0ABD5SZI5_9EURY|nr:hypothetical protein [Natrinema soli]